MSVIDRVHDHVFVSTIVRLCVWLAQSSCTTALRHGRLLGLPLDKKRLRMRRMKAAVVSPELNSHTCHMQRLQTSTVIPAVGRNSKESSFTTRHAASGRGRVSGQPKLRRATGKPTHSQKAWPDMNVAYMQPAELSARNQRKKWRLRSPMQPATNGQWWSKPWMQRPHCLQWCDARVLTHEHLEQDWAPLGAALGGLDGATNTAASHSPTVPDQRTEVTATCARRTHAFGHRSISKGKNDVHQVYNATAHRHAMSVAPPPSMRARDSRGLRAKLGKIEDRTLQATGTETRNTAAVMPMMTVYTMPGFAVRQVER
mmetsp:Transcript_14952/g.40272  ORF Transcript_14952/g.40272 Transcript_14952/m.40272 type:complete len:314 (-) Transcript_14952:38-979(-)